MSGSTALERTIDRMDAAVTWVARIPRRSWWASILIGLGCAAVFVALRLALSGVYGHVTGFMILMPAVIVASLAAGRVAGVTAVIACLIGGWWAVGMDAQGDGVRNQLGQASANFLVVSLFAVVVAAAMRKVLARLDAALSDQRETSGQLNAMVDQASAGIARVGIDGRILSANARFAQILGLPLDRVVGTTTAEVSHPDDVEPTLRALETSLAGGEGLVEKRYIRPDGAVVWAVTSLRALTDADGQVIGHIAVVVDITTAKTAEAALRESEARFRLMADTAPSPVWMTNTEAEVEFVNKALVDFYGRPHDEILGHVWRMAMHPDDQAQVTAVMEASRPTRQPYGFEARFQRADGAWRWMRVSVNPRFDADDAFLGYVGMSFDVTQAREALEALEAQERRNGFLLALTDKLRDLTGPDEVMAAIETALGRELKADRVGYGEVDQDEGVVFMTRDWTAGVDSAEGRFALKDLGADLIDDLADGRLIRIPDVEADPRTREALDVFRRLETRSLMRAPVIRNGRLSAFLYAHDSEVREWTDAEAELMQEVAARTWSQIERARAEAEVRESEERFRAVADTAPVLIWVTREDRVRAFVNQAYVAFHGGTYEEARLADWRAVIHPDDHGHILAESVAGEATGRPFSMEARYLRHDGEYRWLKSFSRPRLGAGGAVLGFVGVAFDVTEAKQAQDDLKRINELLEDRVGEALAEKAQAEADLMHAQKMEAVGRLTGGVAHDFNNLLTVVIGALDMMLRSPNDAARQKKLGEAALAAARRGEGLTHQLLAFSRRQALRPEALDLNAQIKHSEPLLKRAVGEAVEFRLKLQRGKVQAHVDPGQFEAALLNLVVNARDAVGDKRTGRIRVETLSCTVAVGEAPELPAGDYVCVVVSDNGVGMDLAVIGRVFEPFFTTKAIGKGTGLGLSQVYGFARQSGGGVAIASTPGKGTDIRLYLPPLDGPGAPAMLEEEDFDRSGVAGRSLLLVEDDEGVAAIALEQLRSLGLRVEPAETAPQALEKLKAQRFDLMLSDVVMPGGMTGIELARECARLYPEMKVVLTSGYAGEDVDAALADAPWPFLRKPYSGQQLAEILGDQRVADPV